MGREEGEGIQERRKEQQHQDWASSLEHDPCKDVRTSQGKARNWGRDKSGRDKSFEWSAISISWRVISTEGSTCEAKQNQRNYVESKGGYSKTCKLWACQGRKK